MSTAHDIQVIVIGDSTNNTLSAVRSIGDAKIRQHLILVCDEDVNFVSKSRYIKHDVTEIKDLAECVDVLYKLKSGCQNMPYIVCTFDDAAVYVDQHEETLSKDFITPGRGRKLGKLFDKDEQCLLAEKCGLTVPRSQIFTRDESVDCITIPFPLILKPGNSTKGKKEDIHICRDKDQLIAALGSESHCDRFIVQEYIEKEYELDCIGVRTDQETIISGAVRKIRHYPPMIGAGAYGIFLPIGQLDVNCGGVAKFLEIAGYHGPFSVEFIHRNGKNYFMEVNFRNEGLAYASTAAGANLHAKYVMPDYDISRVKPTYMMNYSLDYLYVKHGEISKKEWWRDFCRTRCFININFKDLGPTYSHYLKKLKSKLR